MWQLIKAEIDQSKYLLIILNLILCALVLLFWEFHQVERFSKLFRALQIAGAFGAISFAIAFVTGRATEKRDRQHSLLPNTLLTTGIARLFTGIIFWTMLLCWIFAGKYIMQDITSHNLFIKEAGYTLALVISLNAFTHIIHDHMYFQVGADRQYARHPITSILVVVVIAVLTLLVIESSFQVFKWQIPNIKHFFLQSYVYIAVMIFISFIFSFISSVFFTRRKSYLI